MDLIQEFPIRRFDAGSSAAAVDRVIAEARIELDINDGRARLAMLCLPRDLEALAVGFLVGEGILRDRKDLGEVKAVADEGRVSVRGDFDADAVEALNRRWTWGSGCGSGGTSRDLDSPAFAPLGPGRPIAPERLRELTETFHAQAGLWRQTGGVHACALADEGGIVAFAEDIGRHNAFDKIMGRAFLDGVGVQDKFVLTTGRISAEIVSKAVACRVPMLVSRSAVTSLGVKLARRFGVTLVGFLRGRRMNVYSGFERIIGHQAAAGDKT
ncbi:MAG: formate dehydrogenase accessory sulfurtransferase FdhD [Phycisphaerae bacterium]